MRKTLVTMLTALFVGMIGVESASACTALYVGKDLTEDGSTIFARTEDLEEDHNKTFQVLNYEPGETIVDEYTTFEYTMPETTYQFTAVPDTTPEWGVYHEAGTNEMGVMMDATVSCYANEDILALDPLVENGLTESIITTVVLSSASTAREGIELVASIVDEHGAGEGNSFIIADQDETWYMEILSGHQYAAIILPSDQYVVFPNSFFMGAIDVEDTENVIASADLIATAEEAGTLVEEDGKILVAESYADEISDGVRSRYWAGVNFLNPTEEIALDTEHFPFYHTTDEKISVADVMAFQRNRFEGTDYIPSDNIASATGDESSEEEEVEMPENALYPIGNRNTMEAHIFQVFEDLPREVPGIMWLSMGSPLTSPYLPFYGNIQDTAESFKVEANEYDDASFYWAVNEIMKTMLLDESNLKDPIREALLAIEAEHIANVPAMNEELIAKFAEDPAAAATWATEQSIEYSNKAFEQIKAMEAEYVAE